MRRAKRDEADRLVDDYLGTVREATAGLPDQRRAEVLAGLAEHIRDARAVRPDGGSAGAVREILAGLGSPAQIAEAAYDEAGMPVPAGRTGGQQAYDAITVALLAIGGLVPPVAGWLVGVAMLWGGPRWTLRDKLLGTLVWPLGTSGLLYPPLVLGGATETCVSPDIDVIGQAPAAPVCTTEGFSLPPWLAVPLMVFLLASSIAVLVHLAARARRFDDAALAAHPAIA